MADRKVLSDEEGAKFGIGSDYHGKGYWQDCSEAVFMTSRGGNRYYRTFMEGFIRPGMDRRNWASRCTYPALGVIPTGPAEMSLFATRHNQQESSRIERFSLRTDGFASVYAPYSEGEMITKPFTFEGRTLVLYYATGAGGHIRIELLGDDRQGIPGYSGSDAVTIIGDEIEREVTWNGDATLRGISGRKIRVRFSLKDADLYSIQFK